MGPPRRTPLRSEADSADGDAVPMPALGVVYRSWSRLSRGHVLCRLVYSLSKLHVRQKHLQVNI